LAGRKEVREGFTGEMTSETSPGQGAGRSEGFLNIVHCLKNT
jgi:hypothetical protein